jgi:mannose-1-phosphate guanylyltransferase
MSISAPTLGTSVGSASTTGGPATLEMPDTAPADAPATGLTLWAVVFAGGIGSRFWPLSTPERPKPLLALVTGRSLLEDTVGRLQPMVPPERVLIVTSRDIAPALRSAIAEIPEANILIEPRPLGTAAALAWASQEIARRAGPSTAVCAMHVDLAIGFPGAFRDSLRRAAALATSESAIVALGVRPARPEPQFGYVVTGDPLDPTETLARGGAHHVETFVEKPTEAEARRLISEGALWHSGVVISTAQILLDKLALYTPEIEPGLEALIAGDLPTFVDAIRSVSIERGLLERCKRFVVLPCDVDWDDVGTWGSLRRARALDDEGNGAHGPAEFVDSAGNIVHAEAGTVVVYGVSGLLVVSLPGLTFVTTLERASDLKPLLDTLPGSLRINPGGAPS